MNKKDENLLLAEQSIVLAMNSISECIQMNTDPEENLTRAEAIKRLADAFEKVRG